MVLKRRRHQTNIGGNLPKAGIAEIMIFMDEKTTWMDECPAMANKPWPETLACSKAHADE